MSTMRLSSRIAEGTRLEELRDAVAAGWFPGITLEDAIRFARSDGLLPASDLPARSFLDLEDWLLGRRRARHLFVFGYQTPAQRSNGHGDEDSMAFWVLAPTADEAAAWGREVADAFVHRSFDRVGEAGSWRHDGFASWVETDPARFGSAEQLLALPEVVRGVVPRFDDWG